MQTEVQDVVKRGEKQMAGISQVAAALEQLTVSVDEISDATARSSHHAQDMMTQVDQGVSAMDSTVNTSQELISRVESAQQTINKLDNEITSINQITTSIKEIADQTNLPGLPHSDDMIG